MIEKLWKHLHQDAKAKERQLASAKQETQTDIHLIPLAQLPTRLQTNLKMGLEKEAVRRRQAIDGLNRFEPPPTIPLWVKFAAHIFEGFSLLLWVGAALCIFAYALDSSEQDNLYLGVLLIVVVICSGVFSYLQEAKSEAIMDCFKKMAPQQATVVRAGGLGLQSINSEQLVVGDLVEVKAGDRVPADLRLIAASGCKVDNSSLTGESEPQMRSVGREQDLQGNIVFIESPNMLFFSTSVVEGWARGVVVATGDRTVMGKIANLTATLEHSDTPLAREISHFVHILTIVSVSMATVFLLLAIAVGTPLIVSVVFFISIIVANVPEGLLATVTVCLTLTAKRMAHKKCLVKNLEAVETLGSTSTICSDKTGTLTQNRMTVSHLWINGGLTLDAADIEYGHLVLPSDSSSVLPSTSSATPILTSIGSSSNSSEGKDLLNSSPSAFEAASLVCCLCSRAEFKADQAHVPIGNRVTVGDASESAILKFMEAMLNGKKCKGGVAAVRRRHPMVVEVPFNSTTKYHLTVHRVFDSGESDEKQQPKNYFLLCIKGAPERILDRCSTYLTDKGVFPLGDDRFQTAFQEAYQQLGGLGERVLGLAWLELPPDRFPLDYQFSVEPTANFPTSGLQFVGLISMVDPARPGVEGAVEKCRSAGIKVMMVTGDHPLTARAIARGVNIIHSDSRIYSLADRELTESDDWSLVKNQSRNSQSKAAIVITGAEIAELTEAQLDRVLSTFDEIVFARTSPQQKLKIVEGFQRRGEVVAVTGDGVNDSPALKKADIGVAMGITGSDVSKQAADMILLDDNFASIVEGIEEGRLIFDNLKKSIGYTLTSNIPEMTPFLLFVLVGVPLPLGTITIFCIDVGTDILPAISLAYEPPEADLMLRRPRSREEHLVSCPLLTMAYLKIGPLQAAAGLMAYIAIMAQHGFFWRTLVGSRQRGWLDVQLEDMTDDFGQQWSYAARRRLEYTCQTAFFVTVVVTQWFDLIISKTRRNSFLVQGMQNEVLNFALIVETTLAIFLSYGPGMPQLLQLYPLRLSWWLFGLPFGLLMVAYDELRRYLIRRTPGGFFERELFW